MTTRIGSAQKGISLGELNRNPEGVPAELHQTTWCAEKNNLGLFVRNGMARGSQV